MSIRTIAEQALAHMFGNGCIDTGGMSETAIWDQIEAQLQFTLEDMEIELDQEDQIKVLDVIAEIRS